MDAIATGIAAFGITLGLGALADVSAEYRAESICVTAPEYAGPDCGHRDDTDGDGWIDRIEEDYPDWDCRTMGNRICGPDD